MFTGLIQTVGTLSTLSETEVQVTCNDVRLLHDLELGDSVAVDGVCLTVMRCLSDGFVAAVSPETLDRTALGRRNAEMPVNLEASLRVGSKLGGHFVTGHVDGAGYLESAIPTETSWEMRFAVGDRRVARYIVPKGSIAVNGISLTVADCDAAGSWFMVAVIPLTYAETNLQYLRPGDHVNLEGDILGKYVEKFLRLGSSDALSTPELSEALPDSLTPAFLAEHGYL
jgi:riboflavin synthase